MNDALAMLGPLAGRLLLAGIFLFSGWMKLTATGRAAAAIAGHGLPYATAGAYVAGVAEVVGGLALVLGLKTRAASIAFVVYLVIVTYVFHWHPALRGDRAQLANVLKNAAIAGGMLLLASHGPGRASIDRG
ncbi:MAG: DoxX family protein [Anaeromyxobacteraceae bacterium]